MPDLVDSLNFAVFKGEYYYGASIQDSLNSSSDVEAIIVSRVKAVGISVICALALTMTVFYATYHICASLVWAVVHLDSPLKYISQTRTILVGVSEFIRQFLGTCVGSVVGIVSPETAKIWFLPGDQSYLTHDFSPENVAKTYKMLAIIHKLFEKNMIEYSLVDGSLLGAQRHGGIFGWDDDVDLLVPKDYENNLLSLKEELNKHGLLLKKIFSSVFTGYKVCCPSDKVLEETVGNARYHYPFVDLTFGRKEGGRVSYDNDNWRNAWYPLGYFTEEDWNKRELWNFGPIQAMGIPQSQGEAWCNRAYGFGCLDVGYSRTFNHSTFQTVLPRKIFLKKEANGKMHPAPFDEQVFATAFTRQDAVTPEIAALQLAYDNNTLSLPKTPTQ